MTWSAKLSRSLTLKSGRKLATLRDAADVLLGPPFDVVTHSDVLAHAIKLLMEAAETGNLAQRRAATDQVARALRDPDANRFGIK